MFETVMQTNILAGEADICNIKQNHQLWIKQTKFYNVPFCSANTVALRYRE